MKSLLLKSEYQEIENISNLQKVCLDRSINNSDYLKIKLSFSDDDILEIVFYLCNGISRLDFQNNIATIDFTFFSKKAEIKFCSGFKLDDELRLFYNTI